MSGPQLSCGAPGPGGSRALGCCQGRGAGAGRVRSRCPQGRRGLCCASPPARPEPGIARGEDVGRFAQCIFEVFSAKSPSSSSFLHAHHARRLHWALANRSPSHLASPPTCSGVPFPRHPQEGVPQRWVHHPLRREPHRLPTLPATNTRAVPAAGGWGEAARTRSSGKPFEEMTPNKSGGFIQIRFGPGERGAFVGSEAAEPAVHLPRSPCRRLRRQRQQLARPPAPAPAEGASTALNAPFDGVCQGAG